MASPDNFNQSQDLPPPQDHPGFKDSLQVFLQRLGHHLRLRWTLIGAEAQAAAGHFGRVAAAVVVVLAAGVLAYLGGWATLLVWVTRRWADGNPVIPLAVATGFHALAAAGAIWWLKSRAKSSALFPATRAEFEEDKKWLNHPNP